MELIFVRHGQTDLNLKKVYQGKINASLNQNGINEAIEIKNKLKNIKINKVYTSPLNRTIQTMNIILENREDIPIKMDSRIEEIDFGDWDTIPYDKVMIGYEKEYENFLNDYESFTFPNGESFNSFYNRCADFLDDIIDVESKDRVLIVAHGGVIRAFLCYLLKLPKNMFYSFSVKQGCYSKVLIYEGINLIDEINK